MSDPEKPSRRGGRKPPLTIHPVTISGEFRAKESRAELEARLTKDLADADHARVQENRKAELEDWRDRLILKASLGILIVVGVYCLVLNALPGESNERRAWATSTLTAIVGVFVGYIVGTSKK